MRLLSVRNWPQAARMSRPRGVRTGEAKPASMTICANRSMAARCWFRRRCRPRIERDQIHLGRNSGDQPDQLVRVAMLSLMPFSITYSKVIRRAFEEPG